MGNLIGALRGQVTPATEILNESWKAIQEAVATGDLDTVSNLFPAGSWFITPDTAKEGDAVYVDQQGWRSYEHRIKWLMGIAAKNRQLQILRYLAAQPQVEDLVKERLRSVHTYEMISWAVQGGSPECVSVLLELNGDLVHCRSPHHMKDTPLLDAVRLKQIECLPMTKLLLSYGADPNARAVMIDAYSLQRPEVFTALEDAGGNTKLFGGDMVNEQRICQAASQGRIAVVENLIVKGVDVNATYPHGSHYSRGPPLCSAVRGNRGEVVALLVAAGADPEAADCLGETATQLAERKGREGEAMLKLFGSTLKSHC